MVIFSIWGAKMRTEKTGRGKVNQTEGQEKKVYRLLGEDF